MHFFTQIFSQAEHRLVYKIQTPEPEPGGLREDTVAVLQKEQLTEAELDAAAQRIDNQAEREQLQSDIEAKINSTELREAELAQISANLERVQTRLAERGEVNVEVNDGLRTLVASVQEMQTKLEGAAGPEGETGVEGPAGAPGEAGPAGAESQPEEVPDNADSPEAAASPSDRPANTEVSQPNEEPSTQETVVSTVGAVASTVDSATKTTGDAVLAPFLKQETRESIPDFAKNALGALVIYSGVRLVWNFLKGRVQKARDRVREARDRAVEGGMSFLRKAAFVGVVGVAAFLGFQIFELSAQAQELKKKVKKLQAEGAELRDTALKKGGELASTAKQKTGELADTAIDQAGNAVDAATDIITRVRNGDTTISKQDLEHAQQVLDSAQETLPEVAAIKVLKTILPTQFDISDQVGNGRTPEELSNGANNIVALLQSKTLGAAGLVACLDAMGNQYAITDKEPFDMLLSRHLPGYDGYTSSKKARAQEELAFLVGYLHKHRDSMEQNAEYSGTSLEDMTLGQALDSTGRLAKATGEVAMQIKKAAIEKVLNFQLPDIDFKQIFSKELFGKALEHAALYDLAGYDKPFNELDAQQKEEYKNNALMVSQFFWRSDIRLSQVPTSVDEVNNAVPDTWHENGVIKPEYKKAYEMVIAMCKNVRSESTEQELLETLLIEQPTEDDDELAIIDAVHNMCTGGDLELKDAMQIHLLEGSGAQGKILSTLKVLSLIHNKRYTGSRSEELYTDRILKILGHIKDVAISADAIELAKLGYSERTATEVQNFGRFIKAETFEWAHKKWDQYWEIYEDDPMLWSIITAIGGITALGITYGAGKTVYIAGKPAVNLINRWNQSGINKTLKLSVDDIANKLGISRGDAAYIRTRLLEMQTTIQGMEQGNIFERIGSFSERRRAHLLGYDVRSGNQSEAIQELLTEARANDAQQNTSTQTDTSASTDTTIPAAPTVADTESNNVSSPERTDTSVDATIDTTVDTGEVTTDASAPDTASSSTEEVAQAEQEALAALEANVSDIEKQSNEAVTHLGNVADPGNIQVAVEDISNLQIEAQNIERNVDSMNDQSPTVTQQTQRLRERLQTQQEVLAEATVDMEPILKRSLDSIKQRAETTAAQMRVQLDELKAGNATAEQIADFQRDVEQESAALAQQIEAYQELAATHRDVQSGTDTFILNRLQERFGLLAEGAEQLQVTPSADVNTEQDLDALLGGREDRVVDEEQQRLEQEKLDASNADVADGTQTTTAESVGQSGVNAENTADFRTDSNATGDSSAETNVSGGKRG